MLVKDGYWENYTEQRWVDTSYYTNEKVWVEDGYYAEPLHGEIEVYKEPKYIFTRWHEDINGNESNMRIRINWSTENGLIRKIYVYQTVNRYNNKGKEVVEIYDKNINVSSSGTISTSVKFDHAGDENSKVHIFLYGTDEPGCAYIFC
ncbi:MAG: hypothetical protein U5N58_05895 [Actinomycetota bacterium]|nr:hypothetical protein [Actinomycetota bacterium]